MIHSHIFRDILALNPLTYFFTAFHDLLYSGRIPSSSTWGLMAVFAAITATAGVSLFRVKAAQLIELL
jgi:ABC-type polysaccharide/polyol phosphate export permease